MGEDFSACAKKACSKTARFAKEQGSPFKLRFVKAAMDVIYICDGTSDMLKANEQKQQLWQSAIGNRQIQLLFHFIDRKRHLSRRYFTNIRSVMPKLVELQFIQCQY